MPQPGSCCSLHMSTETETVFEEPVVIDTDELPKYTFTGSRLKYAKA